MKKPLPSERVTRSPRDPRTLLARLHRLAATAGATCLERAWRGNNIKHRFRCALGHTWERLPGDVSKNAHCPPCDHKAEDRQRCLLPDGLPRLQRAAGRHGGVCWADPYESMDYRYCLQCAGGHRWETTGRVILSGQWCPHCRELLPLLPDGFAQIQATARPRGGACLSNAYQGANAPLHGQRHHGHAWYASFATMQKAHWYPSCARIDRIGAHNMNARHRDQKAGDTPLTPHRKADTTLC